MPSPYTDVHDAFRAEVRRFVETELAPHVDEWERDHLFPKWVFKRAGEVGVFGAHYPESMGGGGGDFWMTIAKSEELPRAEAAGIAMALLVQSDMATPCIADLGSKEQIEEFLTPAIRGEKVAALGVTEPNAGSDVAALRTVARRDGGDYVVSGSKTFITNGTQCDFITLMVKTDPEAGHQGLSVLLLPTNLPGVAVSRTIPKLGNHCSDTAELFFDEVRIPRRYLLGEEGMGFVYLMQSFQSERLVGSAAGLAASRLTLEKTVRYAQGRHAFGRPLSKRDYWRQKLAELYTDYEAGHALTYNAASHYNEEKYVLGQPLSLETTRLTSMAKAFVGEAVFRIVDQCLQLHGGMGYAEELGIARAWRDQRLLRIGAGTTEVMRYAIAKIMGF